MATVRMSRTKTDDTNGGGWWHAYITTSGTSSIYELPEQPILSLASNIVTTSGAGALWFSIDSPSKLGDGTATFEAWDGIAKVNLGVTGFKVVATSGVITATVAVKTSLAS